jgi:hypothetical protein
MSTKKEGAGTTHTPKYSDLATQGATSPKDKRFEAQQKRVFAAFSRKPSTMLMVAIETGILRANICRYVAEWRKEYRIFLLGVSLCKISKHRAGYYSTTKPPRQ